MSPTLVPLTTTKKPLRVLLFWLFWSGLISLLVVYVLWQARFMIIGPTLTLTTEPPRVSNERIITLSGTASNIARITLNGRQIFTDPAGHFAEDLVLENGYTIATLAATDRYGRTTQLSRQVVYTPASIMQ
jgi:hypothetical protein